MISERIKAALARTKKKLGLRHHSKRSKAFRHRMQALSAAAQGKAANERAEAYRAHLEWAFRQPGRGGRPISAYAAAELLNERNIESPRGGRWWGEAVKRMGRRIGWQSPLPNKPVAEFYREQLEWALRQPGWHGRPISAHTAAAILNQQKIPSPLVC
jgi:hypothetical protein